MKKHEEIHYTTPEVYICMQRGEISDERYGERDSTETETERQTEETITSEKNKDGGLRENRLRRGGRRERERQRARERETERRRESERARETEKE